MNVIHHCEILNTNLGKVTALFEISREKGHSDPTFPLDKRGHNTISFFY